MSEPRARSPLPSFLERDADQTATFPFEDAGVLLAPVDTDTYELLKPDGTALIAATAITVPGDIATFVIDAALLPDDEQLGAGYQERWNLTLGANAQRVYKRPAEIVSQRLYPTVTQTALYDRHPELARLIPVDQSTWEPQIDSGFEEFLRWFNENGWRKDRILSPGALFEAQRSLTFSIIFRLLSTFVAGGQLSGGGGGRYPEHAKFYLKDYLNRREHDLKIIYDNDNEGDPDVSEDGQSVPPVIMLSDTPRRRFTQGDI